MTPRLDTALVAFRFYVLRSVSLDLATLRAGLWSRRNRLRLLASKPRALARIIGGRSATVAIGRVRVCVGSLADVGTIQASLCDVHDDLLRTGLLRGARPVVIDVGANVGQFTTAIKAFWPEAEVLAFEPDPDIHVLLAENARRLGRVRTSALALGAEASELPLHRHHLSAMSTLRPGLVESYEPGDTVLVPVARLDDVAVDVSLVDLLKVDVEGYEVEVLRGATELLRRTHLLLVEVSLGRAEASTEPSVMAVVTAVRPDAKVVRRGRPIGGHRAPICQDVLIDLDGASH